MRKLASIGLAVMALLAIAAVAIAQTAPAPADVTVKATVTPAKGGTKKKPRNAGTNIRFTVNAASNSTLAGISYGIPRSLKISGKGFPRCTADQINGEGEGVCPKKSKVGTGASTALVGPNRTPVQFKVNVYAAGTKRLTLALQQVNGELNVPFDAKIARSGRISFDIPENVQQPVPGLYSYVTSVSANLGPAKITKRVRGKKRTYFLVSRVGCFGGKDVFNVRLPLVANPTEPAISPIIGTDSTPCSK